jgi:hypothetical protein
MKDMSGDRVEELASRMTVIDPQNGLGHCYLAALAAQKGQEQILNQHLSNVMKC